MLTLTFDLIQHWVGSAAAIKGVLDGVESVQTTTRLEVTTLSLSLQPPEPVSLLVLFYPLYNCSTKIVIVYLPQDSPAIIETHQSGALHRMMRAIEQSNSGKQVRWMDVLLLHYCCAALPHCSFPSLHLMIDVPRPPIFALFPGP